MHAAMSRILPVLLFASSLVQAGGALGPRIQVAPLTAAMAPGDSVGVRVDNIGVLPLFGSCEADSSWIDVHICPLPGEEDAIPPGGFRIGTIRANAEGLTVGGVYDGVVRLLSNDPTTPEVDFEIELTATDPELVVNVTELNHVGDHPPNSTIHLDNPGGVYLTVSVSTGVPWMVPEPADFSVEPDHGKILRIYYHPEAAPYGGYTGTVTLTTNDPLNPTFEIPVTWDNSGPLVDIDHTAFTLDSGNDFSDVLRVYNEGVSGLLGTIEADVPWLDLSSSEIDVPTNYGYKPYTLAADVGPLSGPVHTATLTLATNDSVQPTILIPVTVNLEPPGYDWGPESFTFRAPEGGTDRDRIRIANRGPGSIFGDVTAPSWIQVQPSYQVSGVDYLALEVVADSSGLAPGTVSGSITLAGGDGTQPTLEIPVTFEVCADADGDGVCAAADCDDTNATCKGQCGDVDLDGVCESRCGLANGVVDGSTDLDTDEDGVADCLDNCPLAANAGQEDTDGNGVGDVCDCGLNVDTLFDGNDGECVVDCTLREAIELATPASGLPVPGGCTIRLPAGDYTLDSRLYPKRMVSVVGDGADVTTISASAPFGDYLISYNTGLNEPFSLFVSGVTLLHDDGGIGGNPFIPPADPWLDVLVNNVRIDGGAAMVGDGLNLNADDLNRFSIDNVIVERSGRGLVVEQLSGEVQHSLIADNALDALDLRHTWVHPEEPIRIRDTRIVRNGGGVVVGTDPATEFSRVRVEDNASGVAVRRPQFCNAPSKLILEDTEIAGNEGDGLFVGYGCTVEHPTEVMVVRSAIVGNAGYGVLVRSDATLVDSTIALNADGGVFVGKSADAQVLRATLAANGAIDGGGVILEAGGSGTFVMSGSIVSGTLGGDDCKNVTLVERNLVRAPGSCQPGVEDLHDIDPVLAPIGLNGGWTSTMPPAPGSPAIDAYPAAECEGSRDQRRAPRGVAGGCEIGAFEFQLSPVVLLPQGPWPCSMPLPVEVLDYGVSQSSTVEVEIASDREPSPETVILSYGDTFSGVADLTLDAPVGGDGIVSVAGGDTVTATYGAFSDTIELFPDCNAPAAAVTGITVENVGVHQVRLSWETDLPTTSVLEWGLESPTTSTVAEGSPTTTHDVLLSSLAPSKTWVYRIRVLAEFGVETLDDNGGALYSFMTPPPTLINGVSVESAGASSATISWATSVPMLSSLEWGETVALGNVTGPDTAPWVTSHSVVLEGLDPVTFYRFRIRADTGYGYEIVNDNGGSFFTFSTTGNQLTDVPDGSNGSDPVLVGRQGGSLDVSWDGTCPSETTNILYGPLSGVSTLGVTGTVCDISGVFFPDGYFWSSAIVPSGDIWFLVVRDTTINVEGSWGTASDGSERNGSAPSMVCGVTAKDTSQSCY